MGVGSKSRATAMDVAKRAKVSQATVSLVFSGKASGRVSEKRERAVRKAAAELGYRPNRAAQSLRTGSSRAVGLVIPDVTNPFFGGVLRGAQRAAQDEGYAVALVDTDNSTEWLTAEAVQGLTGGIVDGFLLFALIPPEPGSLGDPLPTVLIDAESDGFTSVRLDSEGGAAAATRHLLELGHRRIGHLEAPFDQMPFTLRRQAIEAAVREAGLDPAEIVRAVADPFTSDGGEAAGIKLLAGPDRPTAVVCDDDLIASGLMRAARETGLTIPDDLSIVGFDDVDLARAVTPPLTTIHADARRLGATAFALLAAHLADPAAAQQKLVQPVELVVRGSTAPPRDK